MAKSAGKNMVSNNSWAEGPFSILSCWCEETYCFHNIPKSSAAPKTYLLSVDDICTWALATYRPQQFNLLGQVSQGEGAASITWKLKATHQKTPFSPFKSEPWSKSMKSWHYPNEFPVNDNGGVGQEGGRRLSEVICQVIHEGYYPQWRGMKCLSVTMRKLYEELLWYWGCG